jgi:hypothetical protein
MIARSRRRAGDPPSQAAIKRSTCVASSCLCRPARVRTDRTAHRRCGSPVGWLQKHRGAAEPTVRQYSRGAAELLRALGDDPTCWNAKGVRAHFLERTARCGVGTAEKLVTSLRAFLRYLSVHGRCRADLDKAVPGFASWRLADLPRYLTAEHRPIPYPIVGCRIGSVEQGLDFLAHQIGNQTSVGSLEGDRQSATDLLKCGRLPILEEAEE